MGGDTSIVPVDGSDGSSSDNSATAVAIPVVLVLFFVACGGYAYIYRDSICRKHRTPSVAQGPVVVGNIQTTANPIVAQPQSTYQPPPHPGIPIARAVL
jgi:hypothetical protein